MNLIREYIEKEMSAIERDPYGLAITTYALHVSGSKKASDALAALERLSVQEGELLFSFIFHVSSADLTFD